MPSRSNALNPLQISGLFHGALAAFVAAMLLARGGGRRSVEIEVLEAPKAEPKTIQIASKPTPPKPEVAKPRAVFGLSRKSMTAAETDSSAETVKAGNTVAKTPDNEKLRADDPDSLPVPTDEYLVTEMPTLASEVRVPYPPDAKQKGIEGAVVMDLLIDATGRVREARLLQGPEESLNQAALVAVRGFEFKPARVQDKPVAVRIRYAYRFVLER